MVTQFLIVFVLNFLLPRGELPCHADFCSVTSDCNASARELLKKNSARQRALLSCWADCITILTLVNSNNDHIMSDFKNSPLHCSLRGSFYNHQIQITLETANFESSSCTQLKLTFARMMFRRVSAARILHLIKRHVLCRHSALSVKSSRSGSKKRSLIGNKSARCRRRCD
jgi:hypothetical protein